jgi:transcription termination/antitermination protein NusG
MAEEAKWYVVHTYSGYEKTVSETIARAAENRKMQDLILEINIPMETVTEVTGTQTKTVERKVFPGYVLVKMILTDESWHLVRNVRGVTGFVGSANKPVPLTDEEIAALGVEKQNVEVKFDVGSNVKVVDGPLDGFMGVVDEVEVDKRRVRVIVSMFGRETPVDLDFEQIELVKES